jgi:hypothetical protein
MVEDMIAAIEPIITVISTSPFITVAVASLQLFPSLGHV